MQKMSIDVRKLAKLGGLALSDEEVKLFSQQMGDITNYIAKLQEVDTSHITIKPTQSMHLADGGEPSDPKRLLATCQHPLTNNSITISSPINKE